MTPRPYQTRTIEECKRLVASGKRAPLVVCPTGGGKTFMAGMIAEGTVRKGGRFVWLVHRRELMRQAAETFRSFGLDVGVAGLGPTAPVQVCMVQTLTRRGEVPEGTVVGFDECHHFAEENDWNRLVDAYKDSVRFGFTATPERADGQGLGHAFDSIVVAAQISELIENGALVPCEVFASKEKLPPKSIARHPLAAYLEHANGTSGLVFAHRVAKGEEFVRDFVEAGVSAAMVTGMTPGEERDEILDRFRAGDLSVVVNVGVLTEGFDAPRATTCILARKIGSAGLYLQMIGRALRSFPGKNKAILIDLGNAVESFGPPDEEREFNLQGLGIVRKGASNADRFCQICGALIEDGDSCCMTDRDDALRIANLQLHKWDRMRALTPDKRVEYLSRWIASGRTKGHKPGAAKFKYKAVFGYWPDPNVWAQADRISRLVG